MCGLWRGARLEGRRVGVLGRRGGEIDCDDEVGEDGGTLGVVFREEEGFFILDEEAGGLGAVEVGCSVV